jgi:hypothetical protein
MADRCIKWGYWLKNEMRDAVPRVERSPGSAVHKMSSCAGWAITGGTLGSVTVLVLGPQIIPKKSKNMALTVEPP